MEMCMAHMLCMPLTSSASSLGSLCRRPSSGRPRSAASPSMLITGGTKPKAPAPPKRHHCQPPFLVPRSARKGHYSHAPACPGLIGQAHHSRAAPSEGYHEDAFEVVKEHPAVLLFDPPELPP